MNLFLSIALILAVTVSLSNCSPTPPEAETAAPDKQLTETLGALNLEKKSHNPLKDVILKNYKMYRKIKCYLNGFIIHNDDWSPIALTIVQWKFSTDISRFEELEELKTHFNTYKPKLVELLGKIEPAHELNQKLAEIVQNSLNSEKKLNDSPATDPNSLEELQKEAEKVTEIYTEFENLMKHFQIELFLKELDKVRADIAKVNIGKISLYDAKINFAVSSERSRELFTQNLETLKAAMKIHYADLIKANQQILGIVEKLAKK